MSDPLDPQDSPLRNPPGARRPRGPRAAARQAARQAAEETKREAKEAAAAAAAASAAAKPGAPEAPAGKAAGVEKKPEEKESAQPARGMVCRRCGKYHDITHRTIGSEFECKCGASLLVPPFRERPPGLPAPVTIRLQELRQRRAMALGGMLIAFPACILLISAALYLLVTERNYFTGTCAGLAAIAFLAGAVIATNEWRRTSAEVAAEEVDH